MEELINIKELEKQNTIKKLFNGNVIELPQIKVKINDLKFNPLNTRIHDLVTRDYSGKDLNFLLGDEVQNFILKELKKTHKDSTNVKLLKSISKQLIEPFVITNNGIVLSGNNRLSLIKANQNEKDSPFNDNTRIDVLVIPFGLNEKDIVEWELSLQYETDIKKNYPQMNLILQISSLIEQGKSNEQILTKTSFKTESDIDHAILMNKFYEGLVLYAEIYPNKTLHRYLDIYGFLDGLSNITKKQSVTSDEKEIVRRIYFKVILTSKIPVQKLRDFINKFVGKNEIEKNKRLNFLHKFEGRLDEILGEVLDSNRLIKFNEEKIKILPFSLIEEEFNDITNEIRSSIDILLNIKKNSSDSIRKEISLMDKKIQQIIESEDKTYSMYENREIDLLLEELNTLEKRVLIIKRKLKEWKN